MRKPTVLARSLLAAAGLCVIAGGQAQAQGFFQSLFGGAQPREGRSAYERDYGRPSNLFGGTPDRNYGYGYGTLDPSDPQLHQEMRRRAAPRKVTEGSSGSAGRQTAIVSTPEAPRGSIAYFAKDKTLRSGDVVVTEKGFLVFQGGDHNAKSFVAIDNSGSLKSDRKNLLELEQVSKMRTPNTTVETIAVMRDFVGPRTKEQMDAQAELAKPPLRSAMR